MTLVAGPPEGISLRRVVIRTTSWASVVSNSEIVCVMNSLANDSNGKGTANDIGGSL